MRIVLTLLTISILTGGLAFGQQNKYLTAYNNVMTYQASEFKDTDALLEALEAINETVKNESMKEKGKTWYYQGIINQFVFENEAISGQHPDALFVASNAYQKALTLDDRKFRNQEQAAENLYNISIQLYNTGVKFYQLEDFGTAVKHFTGVSEIKDFFDAHPEYEKTVDDMDARYNSALCLFKQEDKAGAKAALKSLIEDEYDSPSLYQILAMYHTQDQQFDEALAVLKKGIARYPENSALRVDELNIYLSQGDEASAIKPMEEAVALDPTNEQLHYALGVAYDQVDEYDKSEASYLKAIELNPDFYDAYNNLGALFYNKGIAINNELSENMKLTDAQYKKKKAERDALYDKALPYFEKAYELNPQDKGIVMALKEIYARMGDYAKAKQMKEALAGMK